MPTKILSEYDNGNVRAEYDYTINGNSFDVDRIRVVNLTAQACYCSVTQTDNGRTRGQRFPPNSTTVLEIPPGQANRLSGFFDARGRLDGIDFQMAWPYP